MTSHLPVLAILTLFLTSFITGIIGSRSDKLRKIVVFIGTAIPVVLMILIFKSVMVDGKIISYWMGNWNPVSNFAIGIGLEVDSLSLFFALIIVVAVFLSTIYSFKYMSKDNGLDKYYVIFLLLAGSMLGFVLTGDLFNMYVMLEIMTFAAIGLTAFRNHLYKSVEAAFKYIVIGSLGSSLILLGTVLLYSQLHTLNLAQIAALLHNNYTPVTLLALALMLTGYAVKAFLVPCHTWPPDAHMSAPSSVSMILSGVMSKTGVYALIRILFTLYQSMGLPQMQFLIVFWGTVTMVVGVTMALAQSDFKRLLAFHSISQIGYVVTAIGLSTAIGLTGGLYHALNHAMFKSLLFLSAGAVLYATGTTDLNKLGGLAKKMPQTAFLFLVGALSISGIPPFNGFVSKWLIYQATYEAGYVPVTIIALLVSVMTLASFIKVAQSVFFGQLNEKYENVKETPLSMRIPMGILAAICFVAGIIPTIVNDYLIRPAVSSILNVGKYIDVMMGSGYAEKIFKETVPSVKVDYSVAGYNPTAWLILAIVVLVAFLIAALIGGFRPSNYAAKEVAADKNEVFFSGEASQHSHVSGNDLFWGLKYNLRHYFTFMHNAHSGKVNDYVLWVVSTLSILIIYVFIFLA